MYLSNPVLSAVEKLCPEIQEESEPYHECAHGIRDEVHAGHDAREGCHRDPDNRDCPKHFLLLLKRWIQLGEQRDPEHGCGCSRMAAGEGLVQILRQREAMELIPRNEVLLRIRQRDEARPSPDHLEQARRSHRAYDEQQPDETCIDRLSAAEVNVMRKIPVQHPDAEAHCRDQQESRQIPARLQQIERSNQRADDSACHHERLDPAGSYLEEARPAVGKNQAGWQDGNMRSPPDNGMTPDTGQIQ